MKPRKCKECGQEVIPPGMGKCRKCGELYIMPKGLFYGDPTICQKCRSPGRVYTNDKPLCLVEEICKKTGKNFAHVVCNCPRCRPRY